jgi:hypothetical protein
MAKRPPTALYFTTVVALEKEVAVFGGHLYSQGVEASFTRFAARLDGDKWGHLFDLDDLVYAAAKKPPPAGGKPRPTLCLMGRAGMYREVVSGTPPVDTQVSIRDSGFFMDLRYIGTHLYACGGQNMVQKQIGKQWRRMDQGIFSPIGNTVDRSLQSIDGFSDDDIYAVGSGGSIYHWDGGGWTKLDSPTNYPLYCVLCATDGHIYAGGSGGILLRGDKDGTWQDLSDPAVTQETLRDMTEFQGRIYVTGMETLVSTDGGTVEKVSVPVKGKKAYYAIDSVADALWCVGNDSVLQFDGKKWRKWVDPDNV